MKKKQIKDIVIKVLVVIVSSLIYAAGVKLIVQQKKFLAGGVSGITVLLSRFISMEANDESLESILYSILYIVFNLPLFIFGIKKIGKQFIWYSMANVILISVLVSLIPSSLYSGLQLNEVDKLTAAILAGILTGVSATLSLINGFSQGGIDIISVYLSRTKGKGIGSYNMMLNTGILILAGIMFKDYEALIYTVIYFFISSIVVNDLYLLNKKKMIEVVTSNPDVLAEELMKVSHHGCTIVDAVGAYSKQEKKILRIVVSSNQVKSICDLIKQKDPSSFTMLINVSQVNGNFYIPPMK